MRPPEEITGSLGDIGRCQARITAAGVEKRAVRLIEVGATIHAQAPQRIVVVAQIQDQALIGALRERVLISLLDAAGNKMLFWRPQISLKTKCRIVILAAKLRIPATQVDTRLITTTVIRDV